MISLLARVGLASTLLLSTLVTPSLANAHAHAHAHAHAVLNDHFPAEEYGYYRRHHYPTMQGPPDLKPTLKGGPALAARATASVESDSSASSESSDDDVASMTESLAARAVSQTMTLVRATTTRIPTPTYSSVFGAATFMPSTQWVNDPSYQVSEDTVLPKALLANGTYNTGVWNYPIFKGSGLVPMTTETKAHMQNLTTHPQMFRDGAHGGMIGDTAFFFFADTFTYTTTTATKNGTWTGIQSNSIAMDVGLLGRQGKSPVLVDPPGAWGAANGVQRGWIPFTVGEAGYNKWSGGGRRYGLWPLGSFIPYNAASGILFCPIVFLDLKSTMGQAQYAGNTLVNVTLQNGVAVAERIVTRMFVPGEPEYGDWGAFRSWGKSGKGGSDGKVYLMASASNGLVLARVNASTVADRSTYEFWYNSTTHAGGIWNSTVHRKSHIVASEHFISGSFNGGDIVYSPYHGTFLAIWQDNYGDDTFFYSYLMTPLPIRPHYRSKRFVDIGEYLTHYSWSPQKKLMTMPNFKGQFTYDGGVHVGYFGAEDVANGGTKMLLAWTSPTGKAPNTVENGFQTWTAEVDWA